jgi:hypothetical protein
VPGLQPPHLEDFLALDPERLRAMPLDDYLDAMRWCGLSTRGVEDAELARALLLEQDLEDLSE